MEICSVRHSSDLFSVYADRQELVTYISDLEANNSMSRAEGQVYDDACDVGFVIVSAKTGNEATFAQSGDRRDGEGEILAWHYEPTRDTLRKLPRLRGWKAVLIND